MENIQSQQGGLQEAITATIEMVKDATSFDVFSREDNIKKILNNKGENFKGRMEQRLTILKEKAYGRMLGSSAFTAILTVYPTIFEVINKLGVDEEGVGNFYADESLLDYGMSTSKYALATGIVAFLIRGAKDKIQISSSQKDLNKGTIDSVADTAFFINKKAEDLGIKETIRNTPNEFGDHIGAMKDAIHVYDKEGYSEKSTLEGKDLDDAWKRANERVNKEQSPRI